MVGHLNLALLISWRPKPDDLLAEVAIPTPARAESSAFGPGAYFMRSPAWSFAVGNSVGQPLVRLD
jgi:hypothetical protein